MLLAAALLFGSHAGTDVAASVIVARLRIVSSCRTWSSASAFHIVGSHRGGGFEGSVDEIRAHDGRAIIVTRDGPFRRAEGFDGRTAWTQDYSGGSHRLNASFAVALAKSRSWMRPEDGAAAISRRAPRCSARLKRRSATPYGSPRGAARRF